MLVDEEGLFRGDDTADRSPAHRSPGSGDITPQRAFAAAKVRLEDAGSSTYTGHARAARPNDFRPGSPSSSEVTVVGEIRLPRRTHEEVAIDPGGRAVETVVVGPGIWERAAPGPGALAGTPLELSRRGDLDIGTALLPLWLGETRNRRLDSSGSDGTRTYTADLSRPDADTYQVTLELDRDDRPVRVAIDATDGDLSLDVEMSPPPAKPPTSPSTSAPTTSPRPASAHPSSSPTYPQAGSWRRPGSKPTLRPAAARRPFGGGGVRRGRGRGRGWVGTRG